MIFPNRKYRTRDGSEVRIYAVDGVGHRPIHGAVKCPDGWRAYGWAADGSGEFGNADLVEVREGDGMEGR